MKLTLTNFRRLVDVVTEAGCAPGTESELEVRRAAALRVEIQAIQDEEDGAPDVHVYQNGDSK